MQILVTMIGSTLAPRPGHDQGAIMSHPESLASRLHALALCDAAFPDLHALDKAARTRAIYGIFHRVASTAALGQEDIVDDLAPSSP